MEFRDLEEKDYSAFLKLYNESFPENERRLYKNTGHLDDFINRKGSKFHVFAVDDGGGYLLGFLSYWTFDGYVYVEHFAVQPEHRGKNIGGKLLAYLFETISPDVLLEVEKPETPEAERRIRFYERCGFRLREDINYMQPPYSAGQSGMELLLMTHGDVNLHDISDLREMLTEVYNVEHPVK